MTKSCSGLMVDVLAVKDLQSFPLSAVHMKQKCCDWSSLWCCLSTQDLFVCPWVICPLLFLEEGSWIRCCSRRHAHTRQACGIQQLWEVAYDYLCRWWPAVLRSHLSGDLYMKCTVAYFSTCIQTPVFYVLYWLQESSSGIHTGGWRSLVTWTI